MYQWRRNVNNHTSTNFPISFSNSFTGITIGFSNIKADVEDGAPRFRILTNTSLTVSSGFNDASKSLVNNIIAIGI